MVVIVDPGGRKNDVAVQRFALREVGIFSATVQTVIDWEVSRQMGLFSTLRTLRPFGQ